MANGLSFTSRAQISQQVLPAIRKDWDDTQALSECPLTDHFLGGAQEKSYNNQGSGTISNYTYGQSIRLRRAAGSTHKHAIYGRHEFQTFDTMGRISVTAALRVNTGVVVDDIVAPLSGSEEDGDKLYDDLEVQEAGRMEEIYQGDLEMGWFGGLPQSSSEENAVLTPLWWFGLSIDGSGNFVEQEIPDFVGVRTRYADGTRTSVFGNGGSSIDASLVGNENFRSLLGTHDGVVGDKMYSQIVEAMNRSRFTRFRGAKGRPPTSGAMNKLFVPTAIYGAFLDYAAKVNPRENGDVYGEHEARIRGTMIMRTEAFDQHSFQPIMGVKPQLRLLTIKKLWMKDMSPREAGTTANGFPLVYGGQVFSGNRRGMGFLLHSDPT